MQVLHLGTADKHSRGGVTRSRGCACALVCVRAARSACGVGYVWVRCFTWTRRTSTHADHIILTHAWCVGCVGQVLHLDTADKQEFRKLLQLKVEQGELSAQDEKKCAARTHARTRTHAHARARARARARTRTHMQV
jgi:hypothetical protein